MYRNHYDNDCSVWSPQGRIHQIEYAMEAVKQGAATLGIKGKNHSVLVALKRASSDLSSHQKKIIPIDDHAGISIAGLTSDARILSKFMRTECLNHRYIYGSPLYISRLVSSVGDKAQTSTQIMGRRPFGVGLLVAGVDESGPHVYYICPSSNFYECKCMAIGARSQSARTYLERHKDEFKDVEDLGELVVHALRALRDCLPNDSELTTKNVSVGYVGRDVDFTMKDNDEVEEYLKAIEDDKKPDEAAVPEEGAEETMETQ